MYILSQLFRVRPFCRNIRLLSRDRLVLFCFVLTFIGLWLQGCVLCNPRTQRPCSSSYLSLSLHSSEMQMDFPHRVQRGRPHTVMNKSSEKSVHGPKSPLPPATSTSVIEYICSSTTALTCCAISKSNSSQLISSISCWWLMLDNVLYASPARNRIIISYTGFIHRKLMPVCLGQLYFTCLRVVT